MYIFETTAQERLIIERVLDGTFIRLERAYGLLDEVMDAYLGGLEQKPIDAANAENIAYKLEIVRDILFDSILDYSLNIGRCDFRGVTPYLESAERAALAVKVEQLLSAVFPGAGRTERRKEIMALPDEQALAALEKEAAKI